LLRSIAADPSLTAVIGLDFDHNPADGVQTHFSPLAGCDGVHVQLADTWYGGIIADMTVNYGPDPATTIQKVVVYRGPAPTTSPTPPASPATPARTGVGPLRFRVLYDGALHSTPDEASPIKNHIKARDILIAARGDSSPWISVTFPDGTWGGWTRREELQRL